MHTSMYDRRIITVLAFIVVTACTSLRGQIPSKQALDRALATLGSGFVSTTAQVNGTILHYVSGGRGPAIFLLHGFPQDWYAFHRIMPRLAKQFTVIAVDLRGVGGSAASAGDYDAGRIWRKTSMNWRSCCIWSTCTLPVTILVEWWPMLSRGFIRKLAAG